MDAKVIIAALFVLTLILGVAGVIIYYQALAPLRDVAQCTGIGSVLDRISFLEYNATDSSGKIYLVKVNNNPTKKEGTIEFFINGTKNLTLTYKYTNTEVSYLEFNYTNGTTKTVKGLQAYEYAEAFYTSISFYYNKTSGVTKATVFPGVGPVYALCFIGKATGINWNYYASLRKPRTQPLEPMQVNVAFGKTNFGNTTYRSILLSLRGAVENPPNKWYIPQYTFYIIDYNGIPLAVFYQATIASPTNYLNTLAFNTISITLSK